MGIRTWVPGPNPVCGIYFQLIFLCIFGVVPDLETVKFKVLSRRDQYEIREIEVLLKASFFWVPFSPSCNYSV